MAGQMSRAICFAIAAALIASPRSAAIAADPPSEAEAVRTATGIALDAPWKKKVYAFARAELQHPAWGWTHSERDFQLALQIARLEGLKIDGDILFAASFVHDIGAIGNFQQDGVDHAVRSVEIAEPLLTEAGFAVEKLPAVREAILGHMHDKSAGQSPESIALHDADTLDFLGTVGVARRLSVTGSAPDMTAGLARIREFSDKLPDRLVTKSAKSIAKKRVREMKSFLAELNEETADGRLP